jgi:hypothetical protein
MSNGSGSNSKAKGTPRAPAEVLSGKDARQPNGGRKTTEPDYTPELAIEICRRVGGGETLRSVCGEAGMPSRVKYLEWVDEDRDGLANCYARARERQMDHWGDELLMIADDASLEPNDRRVRIDARRWLMSKLAYRKYGDKLVHSGDPEQPVLVLHRAAGIERLSPAELEALDAFTRARLMIVDAEPIEEVYPAEGTMAGMLSGRLTVSIPATATVPEDFVVTAATKFSDDIG